MLFNPNWKPAETKPDVFSLESLIAWLETMPANRSYNYYCAGECLLGQWALSIDANAAHNGDLYGYNVNGLDISFDAFDDIAVSEPFTFGAALTRARQALADQDSRASGGSL